MKKITLIFALLGATILGNAQTQKSIKNEQGVKTITVNCEIDCHSCEKKILTNIPYEKGVKDVSVDLDNQKVTIKYRTDKNNDESLVEALNKLGYKSEIAKVSKIETKK